ncbi:MAG TPA: hypothetical protein VHS78_02810 [Candidatus Elarobacter sp.]|jgi:hypothetical protein|nr:hypothetical protein [Candidatus Elarobacter sp.]
MQQARQFNVARDVGKVEAPGIGTVQVSYELCMHDHPSRNEALACSTDGDYLYERSSEAIEAVPSWERTARRNGFTRETLQQALDQIVIPKNPDVLLFRERGVSGFDVYVQPRGPFFDVVLHYPDADAHEHIRDIRAQLGNAVARILGNDGGEDYPLE